MMYFELIHLSQITPPHTKEFQVIWFLSSKFCFLESLCVSPPPWGNPGCTLHTLMRVYH